jgi:hypothetical protein
MGELVLGRFKETKAMIRRKGQGVNSSIVTFSKKPFEALRGVGEN